jgi:hypothetical protein
MKQERERGKTVGERDEEDEEIGKKDREVERDETEEEIKRES